MQGSAEVWRGWWPWRGALAALLWCLLWNGFAIDTARAAERRVALVIGNGAYSGAERLETPRQDAADVSAALARLGFSVFSPPPRDLDQRGMEQVVQKFSEASRDADVALFYYAGHGVGRGGDNWLIPVGTEIADPADLRYRAVSLRWIADRLKASGARARILIVDACRNNRWYEADRGPGQRGLERITPPSGTLIAYAAAPGEIARDKHPSRPNGLYTGELVQALAQEPEVEIRELIRRVGARVNRLNANQNPSTEEIGFYVSLHLGVAKPVHDSRADNFGKPPVPSHIPEQYPVGKVFRDCPDCPKMVVVPAGSFEMGSNEGDSDERPVHRVSLRSFSIGRTEVTQGQWRAVMGSNPSRFADCGDDCPVENVSWNDVQEFVRKLSEKTGKAYRLPSEAEWEYACRAGGKHQYCGGDKFDAVAWVPWFSDDTEKRPVAWKQANAWGLYDMSGNVWEWVQDCYQKSYDGAPSDGSAWQAGSCKARVLRGGSSNNDPRAALSTGRRSSAPADRDGYRGFRLARTLP
ncbi:MAG TPA: SUMF1/EgtB/PvdO family nonheme iron enzyme [Accumulibacter sp.]|uniref:SUMF1/EgtB/PvdO family nonheme iron enzyme n=1 Tax=Accumulibacter sp. TaxID=2053492 RepID=UPI002C8C4BA6|nr:SUMF1/EgtB/PvdO family nonheme iron enzyme [Accumulibacter sp.]HRD89595.1 SUMF1/EgtB/PvdO family nonheme iron enzyme [Accumulibacter sp.]